MSTTSEYLWLVIASGIVCCLMAWGIGAIDIATSVASGIGAKAFTLKQAVIIILIFEFSGALLMGGAVTETVRTKITDYQSFEGEEDLLMLGMFCSLIAATIWLYWASQFEVPISSAHSIIGGIIGFVLVAKGPKAVVWDLLGYISIFWIVSPMLTALVSIIFFVPMRTFLLRREDSWEHTLRVWPIFATIVVWIGALFLFLESYDMGTAALLSLAVAIGLSTFLYFALIRTGVLEKYCINQVAKDAAKAEEREMAKLASSAVSELSDLEDIKIVTDSDILTVPESQCQSGAENSPRITAENSSTKVIRHKNMSSKLSIASLEVDVHDDLDDIEAQIHKNAEKFDPRVEKAFSVLQLASASLDNFAHGSNDVANAVAPFASIYYLYQSGKIETEMTVPFWMIAILIFGMIIGLATYGHRVVKSLGVKLSCLTNTRGYGTELSSAIVVIFASYFGFPASSAHVQVGAIVGTGIAEKVGNPQCQLKWSALINWKLLTEMLVSWFMTVAATGSISAGLFAMFAYSPYMGSTCH